jgi:magnesium-transporting ATPase (P-type)
MPDGSLENNNRTQQKPIWQRRWLGVISITLLFFVTILTVTPYFISSSLKSFLLDNGADKVAIDNIDFNPFTGTAAVPGLDVRISDKPVISNTLLYLDVSFMSLLKSIAIETAAITRLQTMTARMPNLALSCSYNLGQG